jgi:hypothetical protein
MDDVAVLPAVFLRFTQIHLDLRARHEVRVVGECMRLNDGPIQANGCKNTVRKHVIAHGI